MDTSKDFHWMARALHLAEQAAQKGEVPVGAVLVREDEVLGEGFNQPISLNDPTAHAEIAALRNAALAQNNYRLPNSTLYVTLEPCSMCAGAIVHARVERVVYAASEPKAGVCHSNGSFFESEFLNHKVLTQSITEVDQSDGEGLALQSSRLISEFFQARREAKKASRTSKNST